MTMKFNLEIIIMNFWMWRICRKGLVCRFTT